MMDTIYDYTGVYTIVLTESSRDQYDIMTKILEDCWELQIINVIILVSFEYQTRTALYTYFPYMSFHCEAVAPVILNYFVGQSFLYNTPFFPDKTRNLYGCNLKVTTFQAEPYMFLSKLENGRMYMDGIDGITMRVLSQRLNFTPIVVIPPNNETRGIIFKNGSATGITKLVSKKISETLVSITNPIKSIVLKCAATGCQLIKILFN